MYSTCLCCGVFQYIDRHCLRGTRKGDEEDVAMEIGQKPKESGIVKAKRDKSFWKGMVIAIACCCHIREKERIEVSIGFCNMHIVGDYDIGQDNLMLN